MPRNPGKRPCSEPGCRAWAIRDSDPPLCAAHTPGRTGAPLGNRNALTHGFYTSILHPDYAEVYYNRGVAWEKTGNHTAAIADYQKYLDLGGGIQHGNASAVEAKIRKLRR